VGIVGGPKTPGNTIRKVYLCRAQSNLGPPGSLLFFYKGVSRDPPSQSLTAIGIFEELSLAHSTIDLMHLTGGRSVYSEAELANWQAAPGNPVKVINFLLAAYIDPALSLAELKNMLVIGGHPPQSISELSQSQINALYERINLGFAS
jgi:hypothetical protein